MLMSRVFVLPDRWRETVRRTFQEMSALGLNSLGIVVIISIFMGVIMIIQMKLNFSNPFLPPYTTGMATREMLLLEFSSTVMSLILAGKVGSNIASEIGTMRITEQIDAMEIMGVNSANYLIFPKITAMVTMMPLLCIVSMAMGFLGGYSVGWFSEIITTQEFELGLQFGFRPFYVFYGIIKCVVYGFLIASVSSYYGYYVHGGALDVGRSSTEAVVNSSVLILLADIVLTNFLLA